MAPSSTRKLSTSSPSGNGTPAPRRNGRPTSTFAPRPSNVESSSGDRSTMSLSTRETLTRVRTRKPASVTVDPSSALVDPSATRVTRPSRSDSTDRSRMRNASESAGRTRPIAAEAPERMSSRRRASNEANRIGERVRSSWLSRTEKRASVCAAKFGSVGGVPNGLPKSAEMPWGKASSQAEARRPPADTPVALMLAEVTLPGF
mmetsp:Transcript_29307/g.94474  ORF Transcript_29307/g.94474 Transcript_29307/m.94474 type:complete len:204 (-) Transcript_29307:394-1005(-)